MAISIDGAEITRLFLAISLLLISANIFGYLFSRLKLPKVVGEIFGGLLLGPTLLGYFAPEFYNSIFLAEGPILAAFYTLGVVLLMFISGFEFDLNFDKKDKKTVIWLIIATTLIPLVFGWLSLSFFDLQSIIGTANNVLALKLVIVTAIAITSIPVVSKIFLDLGIMDTKFAKIVLMTSTFHDIVLWVIVAIATGLVSGKALTGSRVAAYVSICLGLFAATLLLIPKLMAIPHERKIKFVPDNYETGFAILTLLAFSLIASYFDVNIIFGAFLAGITIGFIKSERFEKAKAQIKGFSLALFIPIYFAIVGVKLDLLRHLDIRFLLAFAAFAILVQGVGVFATSLLLKYDWKSALNLAVTLNNRGGPCIVLATTAFDLGIISETFFVTLILLAILTSMLSGVWLSAVMKRGWPLLN